VSALEQAGIDTLEEGEAVSFEIGDNRGKENAINITKISNFHQQLLNKLKSTDPTFVIYDELCIALVSVE